MCHFFLTAFKSFSSVWFSSVWLWCAQAQPPPPLQKTELIQVPVFFTNTFPYSCFLFIWPFEDMKVFSVPWHTAVVPSSSSPTPYYIYLHFPPKLPSGRKRKNAFQGLKIPRPFCQECDQQNLFKLCTCLTSVCSIIY